MINNNKPQLQKTQQPIYKKEIPIRNNMDSIQARKVEWGVVTLWNKVTTDAPYTNDWYVEVIIFGKKVKLMTTA